MRGHNALNGAMVPRDRDGIDNFHALIGGAHVLMGEICITLTCM